MLRRSCPCVRRRAVSGILPLVIRVATEETVVRKVLHEVRATIDKHSMIQPGDLVIVAVSGGPDSMCLLDVMQGLRQELDIRLHVAYLHHHMREQADEDARMVVQRSAAMGIPATVGHADVMALARDTGAGIEEAGRNARYSFFYSLRDRIGADRIALGHNLNDQAETVLMRLLRGSGTQGLAGMPPVTDDLIRPLISVSRALIEDYCRQRNLPTITDVYNLDLRYTRNLIRHKVIPELSQAFNPSLVETLGKTAAALRWDSAYLEDAAHRAFLAHTFKEGPVTFVDAKALRDLPRAIGSRVLELSWRECLGVQDNLDLDHVEQLMKPEGSTAALPGRSVAVRAGDFLQFYPPPVDVEVPLSLPGITDIPDLCLTVTADIIDSSGNGLLQQISSASASGGPKFRQMVEPVAYLDYNKCRGELSVRTRRKGDRFAPLGMGGKEQKIQDFFVSNKVPRFYRSFVPLFISGGEIAWLGGFRLSNNFRIDTDTRRIVRLEVQPYLRCSKNCATI